MNLIYEEDKFIYEEDNIFQHVYGVLIYLTLCAFFFFFFFAYFCKDISRIEFLPPICSGLIFYEIS